MMHISLRSSIFLARRYLRLRKSFTTIPLVLSVLGPILGVAVLITVMSVMNGLHVEMRRRYFEYRPHIVIKPAHGAFENPLKLARAIDEKGYQATPITETPSLAQIHKMRITFNNKAVPYDRMLYHTFIGIDPKTNRAVTALREKCKFQATGYTFIDGERRIVTRDADFRDAYDNLADGEVICGMTFLQSHGLRVGDKLVVHPISQLKSLIQYQNDGSVRIEKMDESYVPIELKIVGAFDFGIADINSNMSVVSLDQAADLSGIEWGQAAEIHVMTADPFQWEADVNKLKAMPALKNATIKSWRELNKSLFDALQIEKTLMFVLLVLIIVVSAFCVSATLITIVLQKTHEIGILKAMGAMPGTIMGVFLIQGAVIGLLGIGAGTLLGYGMLAARNGFIRLVRDTFGMNPLFLANLPAQIDWPDIAVVNTCAFIICLLAGVMPALMAMLVEPGRAIKAE